MYGYLHLDYRARRVRMGVRTPEDRGEMHHVISY